MTERTTAATRLSEPLDARLTRAVAGSPPLAGVAAALTDHRGTVYTGAVGVRALPRGRRSS